MAYSRIKVWIAAEILTASDLNFEHDGHITNENNLDTRLTTEVAARTTLEGEHDTLQTNLWNGSSNQVADNRVGKASMKNEAIGTSELEDLAVTDGKVAAANKDGGADTYSLRRLGDTELKACAGNDERLAAGYELFTSSGTFTAKGTKILIEMVGGAAGGGGGSDGDGGGGGGGAGAYVRKIYTVVKGTDYAVTIGAGGAGGAPSGAGGATGTAGGNSIVAGIITCNGGAGGDGAGGGGSPGTGGAGGSIPAYPGLAGGDGATSPGGGVGGQGGTPGETSFGAGGAGGTSTAVPGSDGDGYGAAGGGGGSDASNGSAGGDGKDGYCLISF